MDLLLKYSPLISAIISVLALLSLYLIYKQIKETKIWNKLHFTFTFFPDPVELENIEGDLDKGIGFWKRDDSLGELEVKALIGKSELTKNEIHTLKQKYSSDDVDDDKFIEFIQYTGRKLKLYLNQIETYCSAIQSGAIDSGAAESIYGFKFKRHFEKAKPYIDEVRRIQNDNSIYIEMDNVLKKWYPAKGTNRKY